MNMTKICYTVPTSKWPGDTEETTFAHLGRMSKRVLVERRHYGEM